MGRVNEELRLRAGDFVLRQLSAEPRPAEPQPAEAAWFELWRDGKVRHVPVARLRRQLEALWDDS